MRNLEPPAAGGSIMPGVSILRPVCCRHQQPLDESLGCCWKCLAEERDPAYYYPDTWFHGGSA